MENNGYRTPFKDKVADTMSFNVVPTNGTDPTAKPVVSTSATPGASVTPKELPINELYFGKK